MVEWWEGEVGDGAVEEWNGRNENDEMVEMVEIVEW